ncbi:MAG: alpha/beta fold hydrolase [Nocardia sp.]|nr:alpha/beta fold hydrolase [Nocardia sp.]
MITVEPGVRIAVEIAGEGPPLILIPGAGGIRATWDALWPRLATGRRCVRYDLRGCGESEDSTTAGFRHADDLVSVLDELGIDRADIIGVSMGGRIAIDLALDHPGRVGRLVLLSPGLADWDWSPAWQRRWEEIARAARSGELDRARHLWFLHPLFATARRDPGLAQTLRNSIAVDNCGSWLEADRERPPPNAHMERLTELRAATLLITGCDDIEDFRVIAAILEAAVPDIVRRDLPRTGHLVHQERPRETGDAVSAFLGPA